MNEHEKINYVEFPSRDLEKTKHFFIRAFDWPFQDYGPDYTAFSDQGIDGGFYNSEQQAPSSNSAALVIFYSRDLEVTPKKVVQAGGTIIKPVFTFPGGRRFHFTEPGGNEFAVWSDN